MGANVTTLKTQISQVFKRDDKDTEALQYLNDVYDEMVAVISPHKLQDQIYKATVVGREEYPIPDTILRINHPIRLIDPTASNNAASSYPLRFISKDEYDRLEPAPNVSTIVPGKPYAYCFYKNSFLLTWIPDKVYNIEMNCGGEATRLVSASDTTVFSQTWDATHVAGALVKLFACIKQYDDAGFWKDIYQNGIGGGDDNQSIGGLKRLRMITHDTEQAPMLVRVNNL